MNFFAEQGSTVAWDRAAGTMTLDHSGFDARRLNGELPAGMRSAVLLFAPLLQRMKKFALPANAKGTHIDPTEWNRNDGFSPGSSILAHLPTVDLVASGAAPNRSWLEEFDTKPQKASECLG